MVLELKKHGFSIDERGPFDGQGSVYYYNGDDFIIGGSSRNSSLTDEEEKVIREGIYLPNDFDLWWWLRVKTDFDVSVKWSNEEGYFYGEAVCGDTVIKGSGPDMDCCLYKLILKILKQNKQQG